MTRILRTLLGELSAKAGERGRSARDLVRKTAVASFYSGDVDGARMLWRSGANTGAAPVSALPGLPADFVPFGQSAERLPVPLSAVSELPRHAAKLAVLSFRSGDALAGAANLVDRTCRLLDEGQLRFLSVRDGSAREPAEFHLLVACPDPRRLCATFPAQVRYALLPWPPLPSEASRSRIAPTAAAPARVTVDKDGARLDGDRPLPSVEAPEPRPMARTEPVPDAPYPSPDGEATLQEVEPFETQMAELLVDLVFTDQPEAPATAGGLVPESAPARTRGKRPRIDKDVEAIPDRAPTRKARAIGAKTAEAAEPRTKTTSATSEAAGGVDKTAGSVSAEPGGSRGIAGSYKIRFPLSMKLGVIISILLLASLSAMIVLASYFFLQDATVRVEENNHNLARVVALKIEDDVRGLMDRAGLLVQLRSGNAKETADVMERFYEANANLLYVAVPGLLEAQNDKALAAADVDKAACAKTVETERAALDRAKGGAAVVFNATPLVGRAAIGLAVPYRETGFEGALVAIELSERYADILSSSNKWTTLFVTNDEGRLVLHPDLSLLMGQADYRSNPLVKEIVENPIGNGLKRYAERDGTDTLGAYRRTAFASLGVAVTMPAAKAFEAVNAIQRRNLYIMGIVLSAAIVVAYFFSKTITGPVKTLMAAALRIEAGEFRLDIRPRTRDELGALTASFVHMGQGLAEREKIKDAFGKFVNKSVAEKVLKDEITLGGERREATIFFSDIRSFTAISERMQPEAVVEFLNEYLTLMVGCVDSTGGVVDKFIGDAIMAVWGMPVSTGDDPGNAVEAALRMRAALAGFNKNRGTPDKPKIMIGCGIHAGPVIAGQVGSTERMEYTVIGDTVNLASRIEGLNKPFGTDILVSEHVRETLGNRFILEPMQSIRVKGKAETQRVFAVIGRSDDPSAPKNLSELRARLGIEDRRIDATGVAAEEEAKFEILNDGKSGKGA